MRSSAASDQPNCCAHRCRQPGRSAVTSAPLLRKDNGVAPENWLRLVLYRRRFTRADENFCKSLASLSIIARTSGKSNNSPSNAKMFPSSK